MMLRIIFSVKDILQLFKYFHLLTIFSPTTHQIFKFSGILNTQLLNVRKNIFCLRHFYIVSTINNNLLRSDSFSWKRRRKF